MSDNDIERRSRLLSIKLSALVRMVVGDLVDSYRMESCPLGTSLVSKKDAWILIDGDATRSLAPSLAWVMRLFAAEPVSAINLVAEENAGILARRARQFDLPISVWQVQGATMSPAVEQPHYGLSVMTTDDEKFVAQIARAGAEPLVEHGVVVGEVRGLEICRVVHDETTGASKLEVGIGAHDREAFAMVHTDKPTNESIASVVEAVLAHRYVDAPFHPYNNLAAERFLRWRAVQTPELIGFASLVPVDPPMKRTNVKDPMPCVAKGIDANGRDSLAVFVHGIDLDVVSFAADAASLYSSDNVKIVSRPQDITSSIQSLAAAATPKIDFVALR